MSKPCPFCRNVDSDFQKVKISESSYGFAVLDGFPVSKGHSLIIPHRHVSSFFDLSNEEQVDLLNLLNRVKSYLSSEFAPDGYNVGINDGASAGQTVRHVHIHLIPRYQGDVRDPRGGVRWVLPDKADYWSKS